MTAERFIEISKSVIYKMTKLLYRFVQNIDLLNNLEKYLLFL